MPAPSDQGDHTFVEMTGVVRGWRGQGVSVALKAVGLQYAAARGVLLVNTFHHRDNPAAIGANHRLGFVDDACP